VIGRFGNVYGPGASFDPERSTVVHALIDRAAHLRDGQDLIVWGSGSAVRSFVYAEDAARGAVIALTRGEAGQPYNIDSGEAITVADVAMLVRDTVNPTLNLVFDASKATGVRHRVGSIEKLRSIGYRPEVDIAEGVRRTVEWYQRTTASR
jgi:GDP-L-fucose synthase